MKKQIHEPSAICLHTVYVSLEINVYDHQMFLHVYRNKISLLACDKIDECCRLVHIPVHFSEVAVLYRFYKQEMD